MAGSINTTDKDHGYITTLPIPEEGRKAARMTFLRQPSIKQGAWCATRNNVLVDKHQ